MQRKNDLLEMATDMGIKIVNAKSKEDGFIEAIHLLNPTFNQLEDAIFQAHNGGIYSTIIVHNQQTWAYKINVEKIEVAPRLMA